MLRGSSKLIGLSEHAECAVNFVGRSKSKGALVQTREIEMATTMTVAELLTMIEYPDSDGEPIADNTEQFDWLTFIKFGLDEYFKPDPNVFVAGNLLWYPVEGNNKLRCAPDAMVAIGRPKGYRGSYMQWREADIAPQVVFEVMSPGNRAAEMERRIEFFRRYGVEECYLYDPDPSTLTVYRRVGDQFVSERNVVETVSPRLGVRIAIEEGKLAMYGADGVRFRSYFEQAEDRRDAEERAKIQEGLAKLAAQRAADANRRAEAAEARAARLLAKLQAAGIDPNGDAV